MSNKRRNEAAPWSRDIANSPTGLPGVVLRRLEKYGLVTYAEVEAGANAGHRCAKRIFENLIARGVADETDEGIVKAQVVA